MFLSLSKKQLKAVEKISSKKIVYGEVGSGKSRVALVWYYLQNGGKVIPTTKTINGYEHIFGGTEIDGIELNYDHDSIMKNPKDLYIITTAKKRNDKEWEEEMIPFLLAPDGSEKMYNHKVVIDSWENIKKYVNVRNAYFIFDENRVIGNGVWVDSFLDITSNKKKVAPRDPRKKFEYAYIPKDDNKWIVLSATPGDEFIDYVPIFIANGFYYNRTDFMNQHVVWSRYTKFPKVDRYLGIKKLDYYQNKTLILLESDKKTTQHHEDIFCEYDINSYKSLLKDRFDFYNNEPIKNASKLLYLERRVSNSSKDRQKKVVDIFNKIACKKVIIFYNYDYELDILKNINYGEHITIAEYNGHKHEPIPDTNAWVYLVQYSASEAWNCILTDTMIFYSQSHSYKQTKQAAGRIDRRNNCYTDLYYYHLKSRSPIDINISRCLERKKNFNTSTYVKKMNEKYFKEKEEPKPVQTTLF